MVKLQQLLYSLYSLEFVGLLLSLLIFYKAAVIENRPPLLWASLSAIVYLVPWLYWGWQWHLLLLGQVMLFVAIAAIRALTDVLSERQAKQENDEGEGA